MPELPDIEVYRHLLERRILGQPLVRIRLSNPFLLRTVEPSPADLEGSVVVGLRRLGKRLVIALSGQAFIVLHLMIAGRLRWREANAGIPRRLGLGAFDFPSGALILTEAGTKRRASLHLVRGEKALQAHDPGGIEVLECRFEQFADRLQRKRHTLKRSLTDPRIFSGIGNAYSDEILHRAKLSPFRLSTELTPQETSQLFRAARETLGLWTRRLLAQAGDTFPEKVTAFREGMAVHGRFAQPCSVCGAPVQRIVYAESECNYCPGCQTEGKILADRLLSRLLRDDWPRRLEQLEG